MAKKDPDGKTARAGFRTEKYGCCTPGCWLLHSGVMPGGVGDCLTARGRPGLPTRSGVDAWDLLSQGASGAAHTMAKA